MADGVERKSAHARRQLVILLIVGNTDSTLKGDLQFLMAASFDVDPIIGLAMRFLSRQAGSEHLDSRSLADIGHIRIFGPHGNGLRSGGRSAVQLQGIGRSACA